MPSPSSSSSPPSPISIHPLNPPDFLPIATLEAHVFSTDPISIHAFGPHRAAPSALQKRARSLTTAASPTAVAAAAAYPPSRLRKAVTPSGQIVGFAFWKFFTDLQRNAASAIEQQEGERAKGQGKWPEGADVELCEAVFGVSDECCGVVMRGRKYAVLSILVVSPDYQGRGIGTMLIREGLEVVDEMGLPVWLGATEVAMPLYKKMGFEVDRVFEFDMTPYGENFSTKHTLMIRPARQVTEGSEAMDQVRVVPISVTGL